ncbi:MAG: Type 1 glutamine amidotransferase-like domain-containing protein [Candidatus Paceibacterota bacterium]
MKLILASDLSFLLKYGYDLTGISKNQMSVGYVTTASKGTPNSDYIKKYSKIISENGIYLKEIDIENKNEEELRAFFKDKNIIHIEGGSTFYLLNAMKANGFDKLLIELLNQGKVYIGTSAGAAIMGITIKSSSGIPENPTKEMLRGLGLAPFVIQAHYTDDKKEEYKEKTKDLEYPVKFLRDGQGYFVEDDNYTFIGEVEEVKI